MHEIAGWAGSVLGGGALIALIKFWFDVGRRDRQIEDLDAAYSAMDKRLDGIAAELAAHKLESARAFATAGDVSAVERRLTDAIDGMRSDFRGMAQRLDRLLESIAAKSH